MSWYANGYGSFVPKNGGLPDNIRHELDEMSEFEISTYDHHGDGHWYLSYDGNFHEDYVEEYLNKLAPYVESGEIEMSGEEETHWKYVFKDGGWAEVAGHIMYDDELTHALNLGNDRKLEFLHDIIDVFEGFLDDKGIVIDNPDKAQSEDPANIYGCDYGDLESEIECVLRRWEVLK